MAQGEQKMATQIQTVETDSFSMDYFQFGQGEDVFVILPGLSVQSVMGFADAVADAYKLLSDDYTIYVFDRRKELPTDYSVYDMARDTAEAFKALGLNRINLFGASQGGMIAMVIAVEHPELVQKLILGSTSACVEDTQMQTIEKWIQYLGGYVPAPIPAPVPAPAHNYWDDDWDDMFDWDDIFDWD